MPEIIEAGKWLWENRDAIIAVTGGVLAAVGAYKAYNLAITAYSAAMAVYKVVTAASAAGTFTLAGAMTALNLHVVAAAAGIGLVVAAGVMLYKNWDTIKAKAAALAAAFGERFPAMAAYISGWWQSAVAAGANVREVLSNIVGFIDNVFAGNWAGAWQNVTAIFGNTFGAIANMAKAPINGVIASINWVLSKVNGISVDIPEWVPGIGGQTLGFDLPTIPALAAGGIATAATLAMIGEGREPEAVLPLSKLAALLDKWGGKPHPGGSGMAVGGGDEQIVFSPVFNFYGATTREEAVAAGRLSFAEFKRLYRQMKAEERRKSFSPA